MTPSSHLIRGSRAVRLLPARVCMCARLCCCAGALLSKGDGTWTVLLFHSFLKVASLT